MLRSNGRRALPVLAQDRATRESVGCHIGSRDEAGAIALWQSLPDCYLDAETYTDYWSAYRAICYTDRGASPAPSGAARADTLHQGGKESGQTNHIERFNNTLRQRTGVVALPCPRQRVSRLVRKSLSFFKNLDNHIGAIWTFSHHYNSSLPL